jgi:hydrogenase maturation protein HypF
MPGWAAAIRQPWRMTAAYLAASRQDGPRGEHAVQQRNERQWAAVQAMAGRGINAPLTSSAGRLFDAVAALLGVRDTISYEGQAAIELEQLTDVTERGGYPVRTSCAPGDATGDAAGELAPVVVTGADLVLAAADDLAAGVPVPVIAARFHNGVADAVVAVCRLLREQTGLTVVALSGGVFQNELLTSRVCGALGSAGFRVLTHSRVPCNDGGISLGQAVVAGACDRLR